MGTVVEFDGQGRWEFQKTIVSHTVQVVEKRETLQYYSKSKNQQVGKEGDYSGTPEVPSPPGTTRRLRILDLSERTQKDVGVAPAVASFSFFSPLGWAGVVQARPSQGDH